MKSKRFVILTLVLTVFFATTVYADSLWGNYQGYSIVKVNINGSAVNYASDDVPALMINGKTMLPLRKVAESLQAIVNWDDSTQTVSIYKPNVNMFISKSVDKDNTVHLPFGAVDLGSTQTFVVFAQVDTLEVATSGFKISLISPSGIVVDSQEFALTSPQEYFWYTCPFKNENFNESGNYHVDFSFMGADNNYVVVAQKVIVSKKSSSS